MTKRRSLRELPNAMSAVAALLTAITGVYVALQASSPHSDPGVPTPGVPTPDVDDPQLSAEPAESHRWPTDLASGNGYQRTPWLGIELRQDGQPVELRCQDQSRSHFTAAVNTAPFTLLVPRSDEEETELGILAWQDGTIHKVSDQGSYRLQGTGIAGTEFGMPLLYLNKTSFNYYDDHRMNPISEYKNAIFVSALATGEFEMPIQRFVGPLHLVVFRLPSDFGREVPHGEFEFITLERQ
ncbi:MAG: hypothetical protein AAGA03_19695 [Planctomycetota bacterium]